MSTVYEVGALGAGEPAHEVGREPMGGAPAAAFRDLPVVEHPVPRSVPPPQQRTAPVPPWPGRRLNDALAGLGPGRPPRRLAANEPWSRAAPVPETAEDESREVQPDAGGSSYEEDLERPEEASVGLQHEERAAPPPPPRLVRRADVDDVRDAQARFFPDDCDVIGPQSEAPDLVGEEIVRALAAVGTPESWSEPPPTRYFEFNPDPGDRPPIIIERARAEQELGVTPPLSLPLRPSPLPPMAVGFSLSLVAGYALYLVLIGG